MTARFCTAAMPSQSIPQHAAVDLPARARVRVLAELEGGECGKQASDSIENTGACHQSASPSVIPQTSNLPDRTRVIRADVKKLVLRKGSVANEFTWQLAQCSPTTLDILAP